MDNGNLSVDMDGCSVLFDPRGNVLTKGYSCSDRDVSRARSARDGYNREQGYGSNRPGDEYSNRGSSRGTNYEYWTVTGSPGNNLAIYEQPEMGARFVADGIRNGDTLRSDRCERHGGENWCHVDYRGDRGWIRQHFLKSSSSRNYSSSSSGGEVAYIRGVDNNSLVVYERPSTDARQVTSGIRNHTQIRNYGCDKHGGQNWCEIEVSGHHGWVRKKYVHKNAY